MDSSVPTTASAPAASRRAGRTVASSRQPGLRAAGPPGQYVRIASPLGPLTLTADSGRLTGLYMDVQRHRPQEAAFGSPGDPAAEPFSAAAAQLAAYFAGQRTEFDLPLAPAGTDFQQRVWAALRTIPYGQTWSYAQLADKIGQPSAVRAVGLANGRNPIALLIPCHRVVGSDGSLTGYGGGLDRKRFLLDLERRAEGADQA